MSTPITIVGRCAEPEMRFTPSGKPVLNLSVAVNRRKLNRDTQQWEDAGTDWHRAALWGPKAEAAAEAITKGTLVVVTGELESREWEKDGQKRIAWEIRANEVGIIPTMRSGGGQQQAPGGVRQSAPATDPWATTPQDANVEPPW